MKTTMADKISEYKNPDVVVTSKWVAENLNNENIRIIESNEDPLLYSAGHIPGAVEVDWQADLNDPLRRDYLNKERFEELMAKIGVTNETTVILYGDKSNWWACYSFWVFQLFGHTKAKIMDGGKNKWTLDNGPISKEVPHYPRTKYSAPERDDTKIRAFRDQVLEYIKQEKQLVDVRSPGEYTGEKLHMEGYPQEGALRGGHIPGANSVPWSRATNSDGTFKSYAELVDLYQKEQGLNPQEEVIAYCRIGERSSHTWFVLTYLLGFKDVRNYDGSWTEWGNLVGAPVERSV